MFEVLNLSKEQTSLKVLRMKKKPTTVKKIFSTPLVHVADSMHELRLLSKIIVLLNKFSS